MKIKILGIVLAVGLSACASAPRDFAFDHAKNAVIVLAAPFGLTINRDEFRRVDLSAGEFVDGGYVRFDVNTSGTVATKPNQINSGFGTRPVALAVMEVPAGDYARQYSGRFVGTNIVGVSAGVCYNQNSPVYSLAAGEVAIIRVDELAADGLSGKWKDPGLAASDAIVKQEFERARTDYPGISGDATIKLPSAFIRWPSNADCELSKTFDRVSQSTARLSGN